MNNYALASLLIAALAAGFAAEASAKDTTPPVITPTVTGTLGTNGWYTSDVSLTWNVTDPESSVTGTSGCASVLRTTDTPGKVYTCAATSSGGVSRRSVIVKRDTVLPMATVTVPASGANYAVGQIVRASYRCRDALSGVAKCAGSVANGVAVDTASAGSKTF